jgi:hypothetical protein
MSKTATYSLIASYTAPSAQAAYTFSSIPQTFTDLVLVISGAATTGNPDSTININGETSAYLSSTILQGNGTTASSARRTNLVNLEIDWVGMGTAQCNYIYNFLDYANTTTYKTFIGRFNGTNGTNAIVGLYSRTNAISSMTLTAVGTTYITGTTFKLYGILAGNA